MQGLHAGAQDGAQEGPHGAAIGPQPLGIPPGWQQADFQLSQPGNLQQVLPCTNGVGA